MPDPDLKFVHNGKEYRGGFKFRIPIDCKCCECGKQISSSRQLASIVYSSQGNQMPETFPRYICTKCTEEAIRRGDWTIPNIPKDWQG